MQRMVIVLAKRRATEGVKFAKKFQMRKKGTQMMTPELVAKSLKRKQR